MFRDGRDFDGPESKWDEGYSARENGEEMNDNPYGDRADYDVDLCAWQEGWECANHDMGE